jgi:acyl-CoA synthetase (AMP-forming)/AMP-acid ligase II
VEEGHHSAAPHPHERREKGEHVVTFSELRDCVLRAASLLRSKGVRRGDRVAILHRGCVVASDRASVLAERFGDATMGVWTTQPQHAAFALLETQGLAHGVREGERIDGWCCVRESLPNGPTAAAAVLALLGTHGVPIARFERLDGSLAGLIERVIAGAEAPMRETVPA